MTRSVTTGATTQSAGAIRFSLWIDRSSRSAWECSPDAPRPMRRSVMTGATTRSAGAIIVCHAEIGQTPQSATLEGRAQALRRGQRGMDAALAAPGHGWPMAACPRSNAGAREPDEGGPDTGAKALWLLSRFSKVTRRKGATNISSTRDNGYTHNPGTPSTPHRARRNLRMLLQGIASSHLRNRCQQHPR